MWEEHLQRMWISWAGEVRAGGCVTPRYSHTIRSLGAERKHCQVQTVYWTVYILVGCCYITSHSSKRPVTKRPVIKLPRHYTSTVLVRPWFQMSPFHNLSLSVMPMSYVHAKRSLWVCTRFMIGALYGYAVHARGSFWVWLTLCYDRLGRDCRCQRRGILDAAGRYVPFIGG